MRNLIKFTAALLFAALIVSTLHAIIGRKERPQVTSVTAASMVETNFNRYFQVTPGMRWKYEVTIPHDAISRHVLTNRDGAPMNWRHIMRGTGTTNVVSFTAIKMLPKEGFTTLYEMRVDRDDIGYFGQCANNRFILELAEIGTNFSASLLFPIELTSPTVLADRARHIIFVPPGAEATNPSQAEVTTFERRDNEMLLMSRTVGANEETTRTEYISLPFREVMVFQPGVGMTHLEQHVQIPGQPPLTTMSWKLVDFK